MGKDLRGKELGVGICQVNPHARDAWHHHK